MFVDVGWNSVQAQLRNELMLSALSEAIDQCIDCNQLAASLLGHEYLYLLHQLQECNSQLSSLGPAAVNEITAATYLTDAALAEISMHVDASKTLRQRVMVLLNKLPTIVSC